MRNVAITAVALAVALSGCAGSTSDATDTTSAAPTTTTTITTTEPPATTTSAAPPSRCEEVPVAGQEAIGSGLEDLVNVTFSDWAAVKSDDYEQVWFIAARSSGDGSIAVWSSNELDGTGLVTATNTTAQILTVWPDNAGGTNMDDDGAADAEECVG